tara:strand:- start:3053 stop:3235 length:183 start_codon:yes stop_codon:yes gene_type:complete
VRDESGAVVEAGEVGSLRLKVGDCLGAQAVGEVESVPVVRCGVSLVSGEDTVGSATGVAE